ncbi:hypothetical protein ACQP1O_42900 (plasmid) [Nocardia sp. CA-151230]|uniref:hypothetical protein n=1 Tax=Nocardia sp. CA-151230 TaxID=3239982 RepID=UPI003D8FB1DA
MPDINPVQIEEAIRECASRISRGVTVCSNTYSAFLEADRAYDRAYAQAYLAADGPAHERKYHAELATGDAREARDLADVTYRHAERTAKALDAELRAWQSVGASVRQMYGVAGRGEGA